MSSELIRIMVVDLSAGLEERLGVVFPRRKVEVVRESDTDRVLSRFGTENYDVMILTSEAYMAGRISGDELLEELAAKSPVTQVLFLAEPRHIGVAMSALKAGSYQYARLPIGDEELKLLIETALEKRPRYGESLLLGETRREYRLGRIIGRCAPMQEVYRQIRQAASADMPVLLLGDTGTGKDLAAQAIHNLSARASAAYVPVNLGALPPELVASELFGYEKGAFTGALTQTKGKFEMAEGGTIFLDEISTVDEKVQVGLLRLIEQKKFHRLGGRRAISNNARIIAASNEDLARAVELGAFREDLYYRLDVFRITMPALNERSGDIRFLIEEFVKLFNKSFQKNILEIDPDFLALLEAYGWPGNVRELKNVIQRAVLVCNQEVLTPEYLPPRFLLDRPSPTRVSFEIGTPLDEIEKQMVLRALAATGNNRKKAAELLGISRRAIYNKLRKHNIK